MSFAKLSLKGRALKLLSQREHSRLELQRKLAAYVEEGDDLNAILDELEKRGFISVQRVVQSVIHSQASRFGAARLVQELRSKGLDDETVRSASCRVGEKSSAVALSTICCKLQIRHSSSIRPTACPSSARRVSVVFMLPLSYSRPVSSPHPERGTASKS